MLGDKVMRTVIGATGSVVVGSALLLAAVGPAHAAEHNPATTWQWVVDQRLSANIRNVSAVPLHRRDDAVAVVAARFDADGSFSGVDMAQPTGNPLLDREALRAVRTLGFPRLPAAMRGVRTLPVRVFFGDHTPRALAVADAGVAKVRGHAIELAAR